MKTITHATRTHEIIDNLNAARSIMSTAGNRTASEDLRRISNFLTRFAMISDGYKNRDIVAGQVADDLTKLADDLFQFSIFGGES